MHTAGNPADFKERHNHGDVGPLSGPILTA
jgi:hypothetical protein